MGLKSKLENIEKEVKITAGGNVEEVFEYNNHMSIEQKLEDYLKTKDQNISINIGGKIHRTKVPTLLSKEGSLFHSIITKHQTENTEIPKELFFDRSATYFPHILNFLRTGKISMKKLKFTKLQREEFNKELEYYGMSDILGVNKKGFIETGWDQQLSKPGMCTVDINDSKKVRIHSNTCYTHFLTNRTFTDENFVIELESTVTQTDFYYYIGIINETFSPTGNCMCTNPANSYYIQCDGSTHINAVRTDNVNMAWNALPVTVGMRINLQEKQITFYIQDKGEVGPFTIGTGTNWRVVAGHCNTGNGEITITECYEV